MTIIFISCYTYARYQWLYWILTKIILFIFTLTSVLEGKCLIHASQTSVFLWIIYSRWSTNHQMEYDIFLVPFVTSNFPSSIEFHLRRYNHINCKHVRSNKHVPQHYCILLCVFSVYKLRQHIKPIPNKTAYYNYAPLFTVITAVLSCQIAGNFYAIIWHMQRSTCNWM